MAFAASGRDVLVPLLLVAAVAALLIAAAICRQQALAWVRPVRTPGADTAPPDAPPGTVGGWVTAADGTRLRTWFVPGGGVEPRPAVVLLHGLLANRDAMLPRAAVLARHGIAVLVLELRAHGASGGDYTMLGAREVEDVGAALADLRRRPEVDPGRVGLFGHSLGAVTALRAAAVRPEVRAVVAESPFVSVEDIAPTVIRGLSGRRPIPSAGAVLRMMDWLTGSAPSRVRADDAVRTIHRPVLVIHGDADDVAPVGGGRLLAGLAPAGEVFVIAGGDHVNPMAADPQGYERRVVEFLDAAL
jgi:pimeloyl-ACP methyl ester carboxylesterase